MRPVGVVVRSLIFLMPFRCSAPSIWFTNATLSGLIGASTAIPTVILPFFGLMCAYALL